MPPEAWRDQSDLVTDDLESRREYIKALLGVSADDGRYVMLVVAGAFAVVRAPRMIDHSLLVAARV